MNTTSASRRERFIESLRDKEYRDAFVASRIAKGVAFKVRAMREARGWTQGDLSERTGHPQEVISRFERANRGDISTSSLKRLASAFDVALVVDFVPFGDLADRVLSLSSEDMAVPGFNEDVRLRPLPATDPPRLALASGGASFSTEKDAVMSGYEEHGCGGLLRPDRIVFERGGKLWTVPGLQCDQCGEELLEPDILRGIERAEREERARQERAVERIAKPMKRVSSQSSVS